MYDLIIKNGIIVSPDVTYKADIAVQNGLIAAIGKAEYFKEARRIIDATGKYVMPGVIDAHMHVETPFQGCMGANDFYTQSISAAFGGVTTFMDFTNTVKGGSVIESVEKRKEEMSKAAIDYGIHGKIVEASEHVLKELEKVIDMGCPSFKMYMTYKKEGIMIDDESIIKVFEKGRDLGALPMVHAENNAIAELNFERFRRRGNLSWANFADAKPVFCETESVSRAVYFSKYAGNALLIVHTTNGPSLEILEQAQSEGYPVYVETCPHYLTLFKDIYDRPDMGHLAICSPPLRTVKEAEALWLGIKKGVISVTGSDDCAYSRKEKEIFLARQKDGQIIPDFTKVVNGCAGIETRLPILLSEGVAKGRISINRLCSIVSTNIAKLMGCFPQKGIIAPGSDADIVIIDMEKRMTLSAEILHNNIDYCLWDGMDIKGFPIMTIARGEVIVENREFKGARNAGRFVKRKIEQPILHSFSLR